jgi:hypothetical protein
MSTFSEMVLIDELALQACIAQRAAARLEVALDNFDNIEVWSSIQSILVASGNISKVLWPVFKKNKERGERLRQILNVEDDNILSNRTFRNHFEHYDERIEKWFEDQPSAVYIDLSMNPSMRGWGAYNTHRGYNQLDNTLVFRGEILGLNEVMKAINELLDKCKPYSFHGR